MKVGGSMAEIGKNIKRLRIEKNMKQEEVAEKLFVSRQTISNYENGETPIIFLMMFVVLGMIYRITTDS